MHEKDWRPTANFVALKARASLLQKIRDFFSGRGVLEVDTPLLADCAGTDRHLHPFMTAYEPFPGEKAQKLYLQTSPEFAMKRLLASGSGPIYQLCKAFRNGEVGDKHNPEFTILEWYRPGWDHIQLMDEVSALLTEILNTPEADKISYQDVFKEYLQFDPFTFDENTLQPLQQLSVLQGIFSENDLPQLDKDGWLDCLFSHCIEPHLGKTRPVFVYDYPASQAMLSIIQGDKAERFECFYQGAELANGYHELTCPLEQAERFAQENAKRKTQNLPVIKIDTLLLEALPNMPKTAGVALGVDRLLMLVLGKNKISDVVAFPFLEAKKLAEN